jgi:hypothetical protein
MTVLFYNIDEPSQQPIRYDYPLSGGSATLEPGRWRAVTYNNNTETILYRGAGAWNTIEAYTRLSSIEEGTQLTRAGMPRATGTEQENVILEPDPIWGCESEQFTLAYEGAEVSLVLMPEQLYNTITVKIINVPNLQYSSSFGGAMSGLADSRWIATGLPSEKTATQAFTAQKLDASTLTMTFNTFGHCPRLAEGVGNDHILTVYAILGDGSKWFYTIDVTDKIHQAEVQGNGEIFIEIDGLPLPKPIVNGSGFHPEIDNWKGVDIEITM